MNKISFTEKKTFLRETNLGCFLQKTKKLRYSLFIFLLLLLTKEEALLVPVRKEDFPDGN